MRTAVIVLIVLGGFVQYSLTWLAMKDLVRRPRVRGDNKMAWALVVLCVPILGALYYDWNGKIGFRTRAGARPAASHRVALRPDDLLPSLPDLNPAPPTNVTSIRSARSYRERQATIVPLRPGPRPLPIRESFAGPARPGVSGSDASTRSVSRPTGS
ncbi:MAG: PLD nuclease N-terminal domain-containing protein [Thermomicrobiales bacterium]